MNISDSKFIFLPLFLLFVIVSCKGIEYCEVYYINVQDNSTIHCSIFRRFVQFNTYDLTGLLMLKDSCNMFKLFHGKVESLKCHSLHTDKCTLKPGYFIFLNPYNVQYFTSISSTEVLKNNTFSGICNLKTINMFQNGIKTIESSAFSCVREVTDINLSNNKIETLSFSTFKGMQNLRRLQLNNNRLRSLPGGIFDDLIFLNDLKLQLNYISFLPEDLFNHLTKLQILNLNGNYLKYLSQPLLSNLKILEDLQLSNNEIKILGKPFHDNNNLHQLVLDGNLGLILNNDSFAGLSALMKLSLENCYIYALPPDLFQETLKLSEIYLQRNNIKLITPEMFRGLENLRKIDLSFNSISDLKDQTFKHNKKLKSLKLSANKIFKIKSGFFRGLIFLEELDLSSNIIKYIESNSFNELLNLRKLFLENNSISSLYVYNPGYSIFKYLRNVEVLYLHKNNLKSFTNAFRNNKELIELSIDNNLQLTLDDNSFTGLQNLEILNMTNCNIRSLPKHLFKHTPLLRSISLQNNFLTTSDLHRFETLKYLEFLYLDFNRISELKNNPLKHNKNLKDIYLTHNKISKISNDSFSGLYSLVFIDLTANLIQNVSEGSFDDLHNLEILNIDHNNLTSLPMSTLFKHSKKLKKIDVSYNNLHDFGNINFDNLQDLEEFCASRNKFVEIFIDNSIVTHVNTKLYLIDNNIGEIYVNDITNRSRRYTDRRTQIYLRGNPLDCNCHAYILHREYINTYNILKYVEFADGLICEYPKDHWLRNLNTLEPSDFTCAVTDSCPENCSCIYRAFDKAQLVNCNNHNYENLPLKVPQNTSILYIRMNNLISLKNLEQSIWENLTELYAESNSIVSEEFHIPEKLKILHLKGNKLSTLPKSIMNHSLVKDTFQITLSNNPWICDCSIRSFKDWLSQNSTQVLDYDDVRCIFSNKSSSTIRLTFMDNSELCPDLVITAAATIYLVAILILLLLLIPIFLIYYKFRKHILYFCYTYCNRFYTRICCDRPNNENKTFDCFIAYSSEDRDVTMAIIKELEEKPPNFNLCVHERNWMPGRYIMNNIIVSVQNSRKTLILLSKAFVKSEWFYLEFHAAYHQTLQDKKERLIIVLLDNLSEMSELDEEVRCVLSWKTYLVWRERWFWEKLRYAIHEENPLRSRQESLLCCNLNCLQNRRTSKQNDTAVKQTDHVKY